MARRRNGLSKSALALTAIAVIIVLIALAYYLTLPAPPPKREKLSFSIATGTTGGVWYPLGGAIAGVINKYVPDTEATAEVTTAATDNLRLLVTGKAGMAFCYDYHIVLLNQGKFPAVSEKPEPVRLLMAFYEQPLHIVTYEGSGINTIYDLKGKRVSTGPPTSGTEEQALYVLSALGIDPDKDFIREKLSPADSGAAMKDGKLDAFFWSGAVPTSSIVDLATTPGFKIKFVPISGEIADKIIQKYPAVFHKTKIPKGSYPGLEEDVDTIAITAVIAVMDKFPADRLYEIIKAIFDHKDELAAAWKKAVYLTPEKAYVQAGEEARKYLHPGAE
ncbi:MAG: TAXI family TRAP transporter solute-binding subunit, partial [Candidatus Methanodesulfokora sp.]